MSTNSLYALVTGAIWRAEQLEEHKDGSAPLAWEEVSKLEEELATTLPVSQPEGRIARRGAVRAALKAQDYVRAQSLAKRYLAEKEAPESFQITLREILHKGAIEARYRERGHEHLRLMFNRLREELSPRGWQLFTLLFVHNLSQAEIQKATGLSATAVYTWRSRLRHLAQKLLAEISGTGASSRKNHPDEVGEGKPPRATRREPGVTSKLDTQAPDRRPERASNRGRKRSKPTIAGSLLPADTVQDPRLGAELPKKS